MLLAAAACLPLRGFPRPWASADPNLRIHRHWRGQRWLLVVDELGQRLLQQLVLLWLMFQLDDVGCS